MSRAEGSSEGQSRQMGSIEAIHIAPDSGVDMEAVDEVEAVAGKGLRGDRYFEGIGFWNVLAENSEHAVASDITFIESEAIEAIARDYDLELDPGEHRRNVTTHGVPLNHLVGRRFTVGEAVCEGMNLCEPCGYMQALTGRDGVAKALKHRGGLDAKIIESGTIRVGDTIEW